MKKIKYLTLATIIAMILALGACGRADIDNEQPNMGAEYIPTLEPVSVTTFTGVYVLEGHENSGMNMIFNNNIFRIALTHVEMGLDGDGHVAFGGTFAIDNDARVINLYFIEEDLTSVLLDLTDFFLANTAELNQLFENEEFAITMNTVVEEMIMQLRQEFYGLQLYFSDNFDRLYSRESNEVFVRVIQ